MSKILIAAISMLGVMSAVYAQNWQDSGYGFLPPGNYMTSCVDANVFIVNGTGTSLVAMCLKDNGQTVRAHLAKADSCKFVENIDGVLTCTGGF